MAFRLFYSGGVPCSSYIFARVQSKLNDSESEAAETQVWLEFSVKCNYLDAAVGRELYATYDNILGKLVNMILHPEQWIIKR